MTAPFLVAVNFHYVGMPRFPYSGLHSLSVREFREIIEDLGRHFEFVGSDTLCRWIRDGRTLPSRACIITFDDGLTCQGDVALPILQEMGVPAIFFVLGMPLAGGRALPVHQLHWLRAHLPHAELEKRVLAAYRKVTGQEADLRSINTDAIWHHMDPLEVGRLKHFLHYGMDARTNEAVVSQLFAEVVDDEGAFVRQFYMSQDAVRVVDALNGYAIGGHGYSHRPMATLTDAEAHKEFRLTRAVLDETLPQRLRGFSYPHGSAGAVSHREAALAREHGFEFAFTMERAVNGSLAQPNLLARIDCIETPKGKQALFDFSGDRPIRLTPGDGPFRRRYLGAPDIAVDQSAADAVESFPATSH